MSNQRTTPALGLVLLLTLLLVPALPALAGTVVEVVITVEAGDAGDAEFDVSNMQAGEMQTFTTDAGTPIYVTRTESGYHLEINGKEINISEDGHEPHSHAGDGEHVIIKKRKEVHSGEHVEHEGGEGERRVIKRITTDDDGGEDVEVRVIGGDGDLELEELAGGEGKRVIKRVIDEGDGEKRVEVRVLGEGEELDIDDEMAFDEMELDEDFDGERDVRVMVRSDGEDDGDRIKVKIRKTVREEG